MAAGPYGCRSCGVAACSYYDDTNGPGCNSWVRRGSATVLHKITLPPAPRHIVLSADIGTSHVVEERVHINRIEVQSDDPDRFAFGLVESAEALKRVADERTAERRARDHAATAASTTPCQSYGCTGRMVRVEGTVGYGCSKCNTWESALTAEARGQGTATRVSAAALPAHWERTVTPAAMDHARWLAYQGSPPLFAQRGETDAPGTPRPADCTCSSFQKCDYCRCIEAATAAQDKTEAAARANLFTAALAKPFAPTVWIDTGPVPGGGIPRVPGHPDDTVDPLDVEYDGLTLRGLLVWDRRNRTEDTEQGKMFFTAAQRAAVSAHWSAQLRAKVDAAKQ